MKACRKSVFSSFLPLKSCPENMLFFWSPVSTTDSQTELLGVVLVCHTSAFLLSQLHTSLLLSLSLSFSLCLSLSLSAFLLVLSELQVVNGWWGVQFCGNTALKQYKH